ncbi:glycosyltransferase family 2 protein [Streptomyces sp. NPDC058239]|uniref:glycosyltransferase family 2 protein n=1 Tax=Streptomyces sp. NPDC058239 TaxID=3346395 RepID=UPI0036F0899B
MTGRPDVLAVPDVTVVVAVYNTMPSLTECLESLVGQSIGLGRIEIIAVDDGSTDGSGEELDRFADRFPGTFTVIHQENSGGPARPNNVALAKAAGRYVFFVGSDDYLGPEALERLVAMADASDSDVVLGKMVAVGDRSIPRAVFRSTEANIPLIGSGALYAISNTKMYKRALIEEHDIRYAEDLPVSCDMPFTLEMYVRAKTISVVADYDCYYAVRRGDDSNITYRARFENRLKVCAYALDKLLELAGPGELYDAFAIRLLKVDLAWIFGENFLAMTPERRAECVRATAEFMEDHYGTSFDSMEHRLSVPERLRFRWVFAGQVEELTELVRMDTSGTMPPTVLEDGNAYARYPGFRDSLYALPDSSFKLIGTVVGRLGSGTELQSADWYQDGDGFALDVSVRVPVLGDTDSVYVRLASGSLPTSADKAGARCLDKGQQLPAPVGDFSRTPAPGGEATLITARIPLRREQAKLGLRVSVDAGGRTYEIPVRGKGHPMPLARRWGADDPYRVAARVNPKGRMVISTGPLHPPKKPLGSRLRSLLTGAKRSKRK